MKWVMTPRGVNSVHYPPYFEIIYGTFKIDHSKAVDIIPWSMSSSCNTHVPAWTQVSKDDQASPVLSVTTCCRKSQRTLATRPRLKPIGILLSICLSTRLSLGDSLEELGALAPGRQVGLTHEDIPIEEERSVCLPCQNLLTVMTVAP